MTLKKLVFAGLLSAAVPAQAEDWWLVSHGAEVAGFIDRDSLRGEDEVRGTLWRVYYWPDGHSGARSNKVQMRWDCRRNVVTELSTLTYDSDGRQIGHFRALRSEQAPGRVRKGEIGRAELDFACGKPSRTERFARRAEMPVVEAVGKAYALHEIGFTFTDAFALTLTDPAASAYEEMFASIVPGRKRATVARILGSSDSDAVPRVDGF
jgi:hypothetical protein